MAFLCSFERLHQLVLLRQAGPLRKIVQAFRRILQILLRVALVSEGKRQKALLMGKGFDHGTDPTRKGVARPPTSTYYPEHAMKAKTPQTTTTSTRPTTERRVTFESHGETLTGVLHLPDDRQPDERLPAISILGPMTFVKEQAPTEYARRFAERGFAALAFDPRYRGESTGEPRTFENPEAKIEDAHAATDFLSSRPEVAPDRILAFAVCQGSSEMIRAAVEDDRLKALVTVAGHYRDHEADVEWMGSEESLAKRRQKGEAAKATYEATGDVEYVPAVDAERMDVGMPGKIVYDWYQPWADRGIWENRYAVMSDADLLAYESKSAAERLEKPYLMIHSDHSFLPNAARRHFEVVPANEKRLQWEGETGHLQYYDDPEVLDRTADQAAEWFQTHLH